VIQYGDERWNSMLPIAIFVLVVLTVGLPLLLAIYLACHRNKLDTVAVLSRFGWSYDRYSNGVEWWGIHEIIRKAILTGLLIYIPSISLRVCVALITSILAVMNLNFFAPFKNKIVFWVSEVAFVMTAIKYVVAMLRLSTPEENTDVEARTEAVGTFLIAIDVLSFTLFFFGGVLCIIYLANSWNAAEEENGLPRDVDMGIIASARRTSQVRRATSTQVRPVKMKKDMSRKDISSWGRGDGGGGGGDGVEKVVGTKVDDSIVVLSETWSEVPPINQKIASNSDEGDIVVDVPDGIKPGHTLKVNVNGQILKLKAPAHGRQVRVNLKEAATNHLDL